MINFVDIIIFVALVIAAYVGQRHGTIRQLGALMGVVTGVFIAAYIYSLLSYLTESSLIRAIVLALVIIAVTFLSYDLFAAVGKYIQKRDFFKNFFDTSYDRVASAVISGVLAFAVIWFGVILLGSVLPSGARALLKSSRVVATTQNIQLPLVSNIGKLLEPFSSPDVFAANEPTFDANALPIPERYEALNKAISRTQSSMAKITTWGCGSIGNGSGFMIGKNLIMTNAHVIAGAERMMAEQNGMTYTSNAVWFDPRLDVAILQTGSDIGSEPLKLASQELAPGSIGAILGYPGGKDLVSGDIVVLQKLQAEGFDIYQTQKVQRNIYVVRSNITAGNSGGPLITADGTVGGIIVGHSTADERVGFALSGDQLQPVVKKAHDLKDVVSTGSCTGA